jgi:hypothetical protein
MDFSKKNIQEILKYSLPKRFQDMSPTDFEDFIAQLFVDLGYQVEQTSYSGDFGADLIATKADKRLAIQVKRYGSTNKVGVKDVNQVVGAKDYYKCNTSVIITTSDFTNQALKLMAELQVKTCNWSDLQKLICDTYLEGKDVYEYFPDLTNGSNEGTLKFEITKIEYNQSMKRIGKCTIIYAALQNDGANTHIELELPIIITQSNKQVEAIYWYTGYFTSGTVYSGASVDVAFMFRSDQVHTVSVGDRIIFNLYQDDDDSRKTFETKVNISSFSSCYIATLCYGKNSEEYFELTYFRDNYLLKYDFGEKIVRKYYFIGGILVNMFGDVWIARLISKPIVKIVASIVSMINYNSIRKGQNS